MELFCLQKSWHTALATFNLPKAGSHSSLASVNWPSFSPEVHSPGGISGGVEGLAGGHEWHNYKPPLTAGALRGPRSPLCVFQEVTVSKTARNF